MQKKLKKIWPIAASALVTVTSFVNADVDSAQMRNLENRMNALEQRRGASGMINPPGRPQVRDGVDLFVKADLLVWNAHENGLAFAVVNNGSSSNLAHSNTKTIHSNWNVGFRVGLGYNLPHDGWDISLSWLRINNNGSKHLNSHSNHNIFPSNTAPNDLLVGSNPCTKANSHWRLHLNQLDFDLGREFFVSKWLTLRPHFGVRTDWVRQKWNSKFRNFNNRLSSSQVKVEYRDNWWGMGPEVGLDTQWGLGQGWSLFGDITGAIVYGFHDIDYETKDSPAQFNTSSSGKLTDLDDVYRISHPTLDLMLGLRYDHMFCNDRFHLGLQVGWEHHVYFGQNQFPVFVDDVQIGKYVSNQGDLTYQGWTIGVRLDF